ncbi:nucleotidyltransferase family protein [Marinomonas balearica]|nr:nucleotidyltransferase family protein [Marinomonas balearica]
MNKIIDLIEQDSTRVKALECVARLGLPQCFIAAGFVRNLVWDSLHNLETSTLLNDVDVIYYDSSESSPLAYLLYETQLSACMPDLNWQVRNQATMHERNGDMPYTSVLDAMSYWPEKETAIAVRKLTLNHYECISAFGLKSLFNRRITRNPKRSRETFEQRVNSKGWLVRWPSLSVAS